MFFYGRIYGIECYESIYEKDKWVWFNISNYARPGQEKVKEPYKIAIESIDFLEDYMSGTEHPTISYSKRREGGDMLEQIEPETVLHNCCFFFKDGYLALRAF